MTHSDQNREAFLSGMVATQRLLHRPSDSSGPDTSVVRGPELTVRSQRAMNLGVRPVPAVGCVRPARTSERV